MLVFALENESYLFFCQVFMHYPFERVVASSVPRSAYESRPFGESLPIPLLCCHAFSWKAALSALACADISYSALHKNYCDSALYAGAHMTVEELVAKMTRIERQALSPCYTITSPIQRAFKPPCSLPSFRSCIHGQQQSCSWSVNVCGCHSHFFKAFGQPQVLQWWT